MDHTEFAGPTLERHRPREGGHHQAGLSAVVIGETDPELVVDLRRGRGAPACSSSTTTSTSSGTGWRSAVACSTSARRPRSTPTCSCRCTARHQGRQRGGRAHRRRGVLRRAARRGRRAARASPRSTMPGRFEVLGHQPLVIVDGAHNPAGRRHVCAGVLRRLRPRGATHPRRRHAARSRRRCSPRSAPTSSTSCSPAPRRRRAGVPAADVADAARRARLRRRRRVRHRRGRRASGPWSTPTATTPILVTGSLYIVGAARPVLQRSAN